jgi:coenzyme PQQ precursor peptide PqqA
VLARVFALGKINGLSNLRVRVSPIHVVSLLRLSKREVALFQEGNFNSVHLRDVGRALRFSAGVEFAPTSWENEMTWKTPKIVEVPVGMEINMYACAARK